MPSTKFFAIALVSFYVLVTAFLKITYTTERNLKEVTKKATKPNLNNEVLPAVNNKYKFTNPRLALKVLTELDVFEPLSMHYFKGKYDRPNFYHIAEMGVINDDNYCKKVRQTFVEHPHIVFEQLNPLFGMNHKSHFRNTIAPGIGARDLMPEVGAHTPSKIKNTRAYEISPQINSFFTVTPFYTFYEIGKQFSCLSQISNYIPGSSYLNRKDSVADAAMEYAKEFVGRPQCYNNDKFFPKTWILQEKESCKDFFRIINTKQYEIEKAEKRIVYIRKTAVDSHLGKGVQVVNEEEEHDLRTLYKNGAACGSVKNKTIVQDYINKPLLIHGHKFDFRMFMLIASTNPLLVYYYDGSVRVSLYKYDPNSDDKKVLLTNIGLNKGLYQKAAEGELFNGMTDEQMKDWQQSNFDRLHKYLMEAGRVTDPNWLDNYLRPEFKKAMIHLVRMTSKHYHKDSSLYGFYGLDFMLDDDLTLWFIEANAGPSLNGGGYSVENEKYFTRVGSEHYEIVMGLLRSRMKRVVNFINELTTTGAVSDNGLGQVTFDDLDVRRAQFKQITQNYFEEEFLPKASNGYAKIIDERLEGAAKYMGFVDEACL